MKIGSPGALGGYLQETSCSNIDNLAVIWAYWWGGWGRLGISAGSQVAGGLFPTGVRLWAARGGIIKKDKLSLIYSKICGKVNDKPFLRLEES